MPAGSWPTPIGGLSSVADARSIRLTVPSLRLATHTSCLPRLIASGRSPTLTFAVTVGVPWSWMRRTVSVPAPPTHTTPLPATTPSGRTPTSSRSPCFLVAGGVEDGEGRAALVGDEDATLVGGDPVRAVADLDRGDRPSRRRRSRAWRWRSPSRWPWRAWPSEWPAPWRRACRRRRRPPRAPRPPARRSGSRAPRSPARARRRCGHGESFGSSSAFGAAASASATAAGFGP